MTKEIIAVLLFGVMAGILTGFTRDFPEVAGYVNAVFVFVVYVTGWRHGKKKS